MLTLVTSCKMYFITGMLSKSAGQTLRVAACLNVLFRIRNDNEPWPANESFNTTTEDVIIADAIQAASNFVDVCCIQAAYMAGRSTEPAEISSIASDDCKNNNADDRSNEKLLLLLPGKRINLSDVLAAKKFRSRGGKVAALEAMTNLQTNGLGVLQDLPSSKHSSSQVRMKSNKPKHTHNIVCIQETVRDI